MLSGPAPCHSGFVRVTAVNKHLHNVSIKRAGEHTFCSPERRRSASATDFAQVEAEVSVTSQLPADTW